MYKIKKIKGREIIDSRGNPTVEVEIIAEENALYKRKILKAWAQVPSGASTGKYEAIELRDGEKEYNGKGVKKAIKNIDKIIFPALKNINVTKQERIDGILIGLDGTKNKSNLGANAILAVSMAIARLGAMAKNKKLYEYINSLSINDTDEKFELPRPFFNVINGGVHAGNKMPFQEFMISPNLGSFEKNYKAGVEIYQKLKEILKEKYGGLSTLLGDEGGFAPDDIDNPEDVFKILNKAVKRAGYENKVDYAIDVAASEFYKNDNYDLGFKEKKRNQKSVLDMIEIYKKIVKKYPIISIEDPFNEDDFLAFAQLKKELKKVQIVGDDLTVTNKERIQKAINNQSINALLLKLNQIGTVSEAIEASNLAKKQG
jgi:enolase